MIKSERQFHPVITLNALSFRKEGRMNIIKEQPSNSPLQNKGEGSIAGVSVGLGEPRWSLNNPAKNLLEFVKLDFFSGSHCNNGLQAVRH